MCRLTSFSVAGFQLAGWITALAAGRMSDQGGGERSEESCSHEQDWCARQPAHRRVQVAHEREKLSFYGWKVHLKAYVVSSEQLKLCSVHMLISSLYLHVWKLWCSSQRCSFFFQVSVNDSNDSDSVDRKTYTIVDLLRTPNMRRKTLNSSFNW